MKYLAPLLLIILTGCSTVVPVTQRFPAVPQKLTEKCPPLKMLEDSPKLSDVSKTITQNYTAYNECAVRNTAWIEWYESQKTIYESITK
jgi:hypothetical protein